MIEMSEWMDLLGAIGTPVNLLPFVLVGMAIVYYARPSYADARLLVFGSILGLTIGLIQVAFNLLVQGSVFNTALVEAAIIVVAKWYTSRRKK